MLEANPMAEVCCDLPPASRAARRRRMELRRDKGVAGSGGEGECKRRKVAPAARECGNAEERPAGGGEEMVGWVPRYGVTSFVGRRRDMEDAVAVRLGFCPRRGGVHFFGVFDGHGCSHVAVACKDKMHGLVGEEMAGAGGEDWEGVMERGFARMDGMAAAAANKDGARCRCELQSPLCDAVGSTAVVAVVSPDEIVVGNCGDSRAVLCRGGRAIPLSSDHKPDRPDELQRIEEAGGRVIYWDGARVLGVLAMSRAIGDNYLKPYVSAVPEVTVTARSEEDECLILASDGLWDVVPNDTACDVARMCLRSQSEPEVGGGDKGCRDAAMLLTKLALARQSQDNVSVVVIDLKKKKKLDDIK